MNVAILKLGRVINSAVFDDIPTAREFLAANIWPGATDVRELPDSFGIGDIFDASTDSWALAPGRVLPVTELMPDPEPDIDYDAFLLDVDYRLALLELTGGDSI